MEEAARHWAEQKGNKEVMKFRWKLRTIQPLPTSLAEQFLPEWVEHSFAGWPAAKHWFILHRGQIQTLLQWGQETGQGHNHPCGLQPAGGPHVPAEAHSVTLLILLDELQVRCHGPAEALEGRSGSSHFCGHQACKEAQQINYRWEHKTLQDKANTRQWINPIIKWTMWLHNLLCPVLPSTLEQTETPPNPTKKQGKWTLKVKMQEGFWVFFMIHI